MTEILEEFCKNRGRTKNLYKNFAEVLEEMYDLKKF